MKSQHKEASPYAAMKVAEMVVQKARDKGITEVEVRIRGQGGLRSKNPGPGAEAAIRMLSRMGLRIKNIENNTPVPHDGCRKKKRDRGKKH